MKNYELLTLNLHFSFIHLLMVDNFNNYRCRWRLWCKAPVQQQSPSQYHQRFQTKSEPQKGKLQELKKFK